MSAILNIVPNRIRDEEPQVSTEGDAAVELQAFTAASVTEIRDELIAAIRYDASQKPIQYLLRSDTKQDGE